MGTQRDTSAENPEIVWRGPFGGIQSELPLDAIEGLGFQDVVNVIFRISKMTTRPSYTALPAIPAPQERIVGISDFFDANGDRVQVVVTPTRLVKWDPGAQNWVIINGPPLTGATSRLFTFTSLNYKLLFSQGNDPVMLWDGISNSYAPSSMNAVPARFVAEIAFHLVLGATVEGGVFLPQQVRWTGANDPTDYTSFNSGFEPLVNELGPITGIANIYQTGYVFQQKGITQMIPTGVGTQPFDFIKMSNKAKGNIAPYSLDYYGDQVACYVGKDNIYLFDGVQAVPIGDAPMQGLSRIGARKRIFAELKLADLSQVYGFITTSIAGNDFNAYWLIIPGGSVWIYFLDENSWTRFIYDDIPSVLGDFAKRGALRIMDLIGRISDQTWTPDSLINTNALDDLAIGFQDGVVGDVDFSNYSETSWSITSGQVRGGDSRHNKMVTRMRVVQTDLGKSTYTLQLSNQKGQTESFSVSNGTGSGQQIETLFDFKISGLYLTWKLSGVEPQAPQMGASQLQFTQLVIDSFTRANENPLNPAHWSTPAGFAAMQLVSNAAEPSSIASACAADYTGVPAPADQYAEITIGNVITANDDVSAIVRQTGTFGYFADVVGPLGAGAQIVLVVVNHSGQFTLGTFTGAVNIGDIIRIVAIGTSISVYQNGVLVPGLSVTDATVVAGSFGIGANCPATLSNATITKFAAGSVVNQAVKLVGAPTSFSEIALIYDTAGEYKGT